MSMVRTQRLARLGRHCNGLPMSPDEYDGIRDYDDRYNYELIRGVLIVSPSPGRGETGPNEELGHWLRTHRDDHPDGGLLDDTLAEEYIRVGENRRRADRAIWVGLGRYPLEHEVPAIVVEFVSRARRDWLRDYVEKRAEYLSVGVREYWVVDRFRRTMTVYQAAEPTERVILESETYRTPLLPGFELPLAKLLRAADDRLEAR